MPTVLKKETVQAFAHCVANRCQCPGYAQEPVQAVVEEVGTTQREMGGEGNGIEKTHTYLHFDDDADADCPVCGTRRELSLQPRKVYQEFIPGEVIAPVPAESTPVNGEIAELKAAVAALLAEKAERDAA